MPLGDPSFFVQHTEGDLAERFLADVASNQPGWTVGACLLLPRWRASTQRDFAVRLEPAAEYLIADPETAGYTSPSRTAAAERSISTTCRRATRSSTAGGS